MAQEFSGRVVFKDIWSGFFDPRLAQYETDIFNALQAKGLRPRSVSLSNSIGNQIAHGLYLSPDITIILNSSGQPQQNLNVIIQTLSSMFDSVNIRYIDADPDSPFSIIANTLKSPFLGFTVGTFVAGAVALVVAVQLLKVRR